MRLAASLGCIVFLLQIGGCASIVSGQDQIVSVSAPNCPGAQCRLQNKDGVYYVPATPGTVSVDRSYGDLFVSCSMQGSATQNMQVKSKTKAMAFGNILLGGVIGAGVDMATGAAYDYPSEIIVPLDCRNQAEIASTATQGRFDDQAARLLDKQECSAPRFLANEGMSDLYNTDCKDGTMVTMRCADSGCDPLSISTVNAVTSDQSETSVR